ncbi:MAG: DegT/DnrJ/EryC1/StrS aminotransferase family protein [Litorimonas sp.]
MDFIDLHAQQSRLKAEIDAGIADVLSHGRYILGPQVTEFEDKLAKFANAKHALSCANGTDAILLALMAWDIGPGDAVFCPSFSYCATAEVIALRGATPVFVDVDRETYNLDPDSLRTAISQVQQQGQLTPRAVIVVDLFGQCADYPALTPIAKDASLKVISDCAQGFGSTRNGKHPLEWADVQTTSFFPAKPLGCYGDGGAVLTNDDALNTLMTSLRFHGRGTAPFDSDHIGVNSRLDTIQAAILLPKLAIFEDEIEKRNVIASRYSDGLKSHVTRTPTIDEGVISTWAQYTIEVPDAEKFSNALKAEGIPNARYYPLPIHMHTAYQDFPVSGNGLPNTMACRNHVVSLAMHPYLSEADQDRIIQAAIGAL